MNMVQRPPSVAQQEPLAGYGPSAPPILEQPRKRRGLLAGWYRLTAPPEPPASAPFAKREAARRGHLASTLLLGFLIIAACSIPLAYQDPGTATALGISLAVVLIALVLNRLGYVTLCGVLLVVMLDVALAVVILDAPHGLLTADYMPIFDLLVISELLGASLISPGAAFVIAAANSAFTLLDVHYQPAGPSLAALLNDPNVGYYSEVLRPVTLQWLVAIVAFLWVRNTLQALRRADRAEEMAALEHSIAEQKRQLDVGIQQLLQIHVRAANGDFSARAPLRQDNVLWQISSSLNNLLARMQRAAQAEHQLARTQDELRRLAVAIDDAQAGRQPMWPAPTGTAADLILDRIARGPRRRAIPAAPFEQGQIGSHAPSSGGQTPGGVGWPSLSSQPLGQSPFAPSSQPLGQPPYAPAHGGNPTYSPQPPDAWQLPDRMDDAHPAPNPWQLPAEQSEQPHQ
jgi:hypothetical protein